MSGMSTALLTTHEEIVPNPALTHPQHSTIPYPPNDFRLVAHRNPYRYAILNSARQFAQSSVGLGRTVATVGPYRLAKSIDMSVGLRPFRAPVGRIFFSLSLPVGFCDKDGEGAFRTTAKTSCFRPLLWNHRRRGI